MSTHHPTNARGFTLIELMIVVVVIGVLAAIAIPNFVSLQARAKEAQVKANMHTVQMAMEDFAVQADGFYPDDGSSTTLTGLTLAQVCPNRNFPVNPFTNLASVVQFDADPTPGNRGEMAVNPANVATYVLKGNGPTGDTLKLVLTTGQ